MASRNRTSAPPADPADFAASELDGRKIGLRVHRLIASMARAGVRSPDPATVIEWVSREEFPAKASYLLGARQRLITAASIYYRLYEEPSWELIGAEVPVGDCRYDLVWTAGPEAIVCDEIKSGRAGVELSRGRVDGQVARQLDSGCREWGDAFRGVRVLFTYWPRHSYLARPDGEQEPLFVVAGGDE